MAAGVIAVFDIGKTNKKVLLFDAQYNVVHEATVQLDETADEDGFPCEDLGALTGWMQQQFSGLQARSDIAIKALNVSAYGASFVHLDAAGKPCTALYNYLKPLAKKVEDQFYNTYGGMETMCRQTASPALGNLNSGLQLYRLKCEKPAVFQTIKTALHLPQYLSSFFGGIAATDRTSLGCHTALWHFEKEAYHHWVSAEGITSKFAPIYAGNHTTTINHSHTNIAVGIGLHDSSAALVPYAASFTQPFILLSTGTWCIALNPFNHTPLTADELAQDCLCYLSYTGAPVKAARFFAGPAHEQQLAKLAAYFNVAPDYYKTVLYNSTLVQQAKQTASLNATLEIDPAQFETYEEAYHQFMVLLVARQVASLKLVITGETERIFVDGGFSRNALFMHLLAAAFPDVDVNAATLAQATALGAALVVHQSWNGLPHPANSIALQRYNAYP